MSNVYLLFRLRGVYRTYATYILSAIWHGFYPGYYFTFLGGALTTNAARIVCTLYNCIDQ